MLRSCLCSQNQTQAQGCRVLLRCRSAHGLHSVLDAAGLMLSPPASSAPPISRRDAFWSAKPTVLMPHSASTSQIHPKPLRMLPPYRNHLEPGAGIGSRAYFHPRDSRFDKVLCGLG